MPNFGDGSVYPQRGATPDTISRRGVVDVGATGAPTLFGDPGLGITRNAVGLYDVTFPPMADYTKTLPTIRGGINKSAASTVADVLPIAFNPGAGTAQIRTYLAVPGTAVDPANGDQFWFELTAGASGVR